MESTCESVFSAAILANRKMAADGIGRTHRISRSCNVIFKSGLIVAIGALVGCGTPPARNFGGSWKPVNHFQTQPTEIPLVADYTYYAAPMDGTLKTMLARWANDSGRELSYQLPFDVTLYTPVSGIRTTDISRATQQLTQVYAAQHVHVSATDRKILVVASDTAGDDGLPSKSGLATSAAAEGGDAR